MAQKRKNNLRKLWEESSTIENQVNDQNKLIIPNKDINYNKVISKINILSFIFTGDEDFSRIIGSVTFLNMSLGDILSTNVIAIFRPNDPELISLGLSGFTFQYRWRKLGDNMRLDVDVRGVLPATSIPELSLFLDVYVYFLNPRINHEIQQPKA